MRKLIPLLGIVGLIFINFSTVGCKKDEVVIQTIDSMAVAKNLLLGKWLIPYYEWERYSGNVLIEKKIVYVPGTGTYTEYKSDLTYSSFSSGNPAGNGSWELISPHYLVLDKGHATQERYYYIMQLDKKILITRGPFKKDGRLFDNINLHTFYYTK